MRNLLTKVISMVLILTVIASMGITTFAMEYPDKGYWANEAIEAAKDAGLLHGKDSSGYMDSEAYLTRAEMAAIMVRAFGASVKADVSKYTDLDPSAWYYDEFSKAVQMRVFEGDGSGHMYPNDSITREEVFTVVARAMVLSDSDHSALDKFRDSSQISSWAKNYMSILTQKSYVNGDEAGNVNPKKYITRAEFAQLMYNIYKTYYLTSGSYSNTVDTACVMINTESVNLTNVVVQGDLIIGDGANEATVTLKDVTIEGRLLVRGSARVELVNTTVGEMVVVNNYNSVVHFDNYRNDKVFDGIIENTKATFKQSTSGGGGGGGGSSTSYTVTFHDRDSVVNTVKVTRGTKLSEDQIPNNNADSGNELDDYITYTNPYEGYVKDSSVSSIYGEEYTHKTYYGWWYKTDSEQWEEFTTETVVRSNMDVYLMSNKFSAIVTSAGGAAFNFYTYYEPDTRFADSVKDILYKEAPLTALNTGYWDKVKSYAKEQQFIDADDNILLQSAMVKFSQILGEENVEDFIVDSAKESLGTNETLEDSIVDYLKSAIASGGSSSDDAYGVSVNAIKYAIDNNTSYAQPIKALLNQVNGNENTDETSIKNLVDYLFGADETELNDLVDYMMDYLNAHEAERDALVEDIIEELYKEDLDRLVDEIINNDQFTITEDIAFVAEGMIDKLESDYNYASYIKPRIPAEVLAIYPEDKIEKIYTDALDVVIAQATAALSVTAGNEAKIDSGLTVVINPVDDLYVPLYNRFVELIGETEDANYYYADNAYLKALVELYKPENLFISSVGSESGYAINSLEEYYDLLYKAAVLDDDARIWYSEKINKGEINIDNLTADYQDLLLNYISIIANTLDAYATEGSSLNPFEKAIMERYPDLVDKLVELYKNSELKDYADKNGGKLKDTLYKALQEVNLTTDEFFDKVLVDEPFKELGQYTKIDEDTYEFEVKGYKIRFERELTDA